MSSNPLTGWFIDAQWKPERINQTGPLLSCSGHVADLSAVTYVGGWSSRFDRVMGSTDWQLTSTATVFAAERDAKLFYDLADRWATRYCYVKGSTVGSDRITSVSRTQLPPVSDQRLALSMRRVFLKNPRRQLGSMEVIVRRGRVIVDLYSDWSQRPIPVEVVTAVVVKMAARAG